MVPGIFIALLMRYDAVRALVNPVMAENKAFPKPYFMVNIIAYALGLLLTVAVMFFFDAAQVSTITTAIKLLYYHTMQPPNHQHQMPNINFN